MIVTLRLHSEGIPTNSQMEGEIVQDQTVDPIVSVKESLYYYMSRETSILTL